MQDFLHSRVKSHKGPADDRDVVSTTQAAHPGRCRSPCSAAAIIVRRRSRRSAADWQPIALVLVLFALAVASDVDDRRDARTARLGRVLRRRARHGAPRAGARRGDRIATRRLSTRRSIARPHRTRAQRRRRVGDVPGRRRPHGRRARRRRRRSDGVAFCAVVVRRLHGDEHPQLPARRRATAAC